MAQLKFLKGNYSALGNAAIAEGQILVTKDTHELFVDVDASTRIKIGDFITVATLTELEALDATKVPTTRLYYVEDGNILARSNGTAWIQVNKQKTADELKVFLGLGSMAYLSEVSESNLSAALLEKVNASAEGNHSHSNKTVLDGITAEKVSAWDASEQNAKNYADEKIAALDFTDTAVDGEYVSAVNEVDGKISVTRKALPDYSNTYDAKGAAATALDNAKAYADGLAANYDAKGAAAAVDAKLTEEVTARTDADTALGARIDEVVSTHNADKAALEGAIADAEQASADALEAYKTSNDAAVAGVKATADAAAVKTEVETALAGKVDKIEGKSLVSDDEIARLANVDNYDDAEVRGLISDNADAIAAVGAKVGEVPEGQTVMGIITNIQENAYDDTELRGLISDNASAIDAIEADYVKAADIADFETKANVKAVADDLAAYVESNDTALADVKTTADAAAVKTEVEAALALKADKSALEATDATLTEVKTMVDNFFADDAAVNDTIDTLKEITNYIANDKEGAADITARVGALEGKVDVDKVSEAIAVETNRATGVEGELAGRIDALEAIDHEAYKGYADQAEADAVATAKEYADGLNTAMDARVDALETIDHDAYVAADATLKSELQAEIDADVKALADGAVKTNADAIATLTETVGNNATAANKAVEDLAAVVYTQEEVDALITEACSWGSF